MTRNFAVLTSASSMLVTLLFCGCGSESNESVRSNPSSNAAGRPSKEVRTTDDIWNDVKRAANEAVSSTQPLADSRAVGDVKNGSASTANGDVEQTTDPTQEYVVPDGAPETIMAFIQELEDAEPKGRTEEGAWDSFRRIQGARIAGCDKILAGDADGQLRFSAALIKINALRVLMEAEQPGVREQLVEFCRSLVQDANEDIAREGRLRSFEILVNEFVKDDTAAFDPILEELAVLLQDEQSQPRLVEIGQQTASSLYASGHQKEAGQLMKAIGNVIADNEDLAEMATNMLDQALMIELDLPAKMKAALEGEDGAADELVVALTTIMEHGLPSATDLRTTSTAGQYLEVAGNYEAATRIYQLIERQFKNHSDANMAEEGSRQAHQGLKRVGLIGKSLAITGERLDGKPFDWSDYEGKVVLVDFWATWCGPCVEEFSNIEENYEAFREKGFEVVGINLDDDRSAAQEFLANRQLPWATLVSDDSQAQGFKNPLVQMCGIDAIPFIVLLDREGRVAAIHVRGPELQRQLTEMLGPPSQ